MDIVVYNIVVATELVQRGYKLVNMAENNRSDGDIVFYFERTEELVELLRKEFDIYVK